MTPGILPSALRASVAMLRCSKSLPAILSNPRWGLTHTPLAGERLQPLGHLSGEHTLTVFTAHHHQAMVVITPNLFYLPPPRISRMRSAPTNSRQPLATSSYYESGILPVRYCAARGVAYLYDFMG